jgi:putative serine protease PepD
VLTKLQGRPLSEPADLIALVRKHPPGAVVNIEYLRGGAPERATVTLAADGG